MSHSPPRARGVLTLSLAILAACGSDGMDPVPMPDTLDFAPAYRLVLIDGEPLPWHQPPNGPIVMTGGSVTVTPDTFKARFIGHSLPCPTCEPGVEQLDSLYGPYTRTSPISFSVMTTPDRHLDVSLEAAADGHGARLAFREIVPFLGRYEFVFEAIP